jgi:hypothetical protein
MSKYNIGARIAVAAVIGFGGILMFRAMGVFTRTDHSGHSATMEVYNLWKSVDCLPGYTDEQRETLFQKGAELRLVDILATITDSKVAERYKADWAESMKAYTFLSAALTKATAETGTEETPVVQDVAAAV